MIMIANRINLARSARKEERERGERRERNLGSHASPFVAELGVKIDDDSLLVGRDGALLEIRAEVVGPAEAAALPAPR